MLQSLDWQNDELQTNILRQMQGVISVVEGCRTCECNNRGKNFAETFTNIFIMLEDE